MSLHQDSVNGIRILSLDSGGPGTYSQALILEEIEESIKNLSVIESDASHLIGDHFDLIGGVGFGGLLGILLGRLGMTATQAKDAVVKVAQAAFPPDATVPVPPDERSRRLRESIKAVVQESGLPSDAKLYDREAGNPRCIVVVFATSKEDDRHACALRTSKPSKSSPDPTIVEAACATISIPPFFAPITVGPPTLRISFIGGTKDSMNPASNLLEQAKTLFGTGRDPTALISLGCGRPAFKHRPGPIDLTEQKRQYESTGSGTFLDVLSPVQMIRGSIHKRKTKKAQLSTTSTDILQPNAGWHAINHMAEDCAATSKRVTSQLPSLLRYLRLDVTEELTVLDFNDWTSLGTIAGHTAVYLEKTRLVSDVSRLLEKPNIKKTSKSVPKAPPRVSSNFVRREAAYKTMKQHLVDNPIAGQKIMVISGMGGCGKTQLVSYFLEENDSLYSHLIYVDASSEGSIKTDLEAWIQSIKGHEEDDWRSALTYIRHGLRDEQWALVLDNADDVKVDLVPFLPACRYGTILITSRNRNRGALATATHIQLGVMSPEEATAALLLSAGRHAPLPAKEESESRNLLAELGHLPLAISLAGTYCRQLSSNAESPYTFGQYLEAFRSERSQLMDCQPVDSLDQYKWSVNTTIGLSYNRLSDSEKEYLELFATFDGTDISLEIFAEAADAGFEDNGKWMERPTEHKDILEHLHILFLRDQRWKTVEIQTTVANLTSNSLLSTTSVAGTIHIHLHPLVQSWVCDRRGQIRSSRYSAMAAQVLTACDDAESLRLGRAMLPHIQLLRITGVLASLHVNCRMAFAVTLQNRGYYDIAAECCEAAYKDIQDALGSNDLAILDAAARLASIRRDQGRYEEAKSLEFTVWEKRMEALGAGDEATISAASNLASTYGKLGRHQDALQLKLEVWEKQKEALGMEHPTTLACASELAYTYGELGRHQDALQLKLEVWKKRKEVLGVGHSSTLISANNLASTYRDLGRYHDALQLQQEVWEKRKEVSGVDHPSTLISANNLASIYGELGRHHDALQLKLEVWEKRKEILGMDHPDTLISASNLASTYGELGRHQDALQLKVEVWEKWKESLGLGHPDTLISANNLAFTYGKLGRHHDALQLQLEVQEKLKESLGVDHPSTLSSAINLAFTYGKLGRPNDALQLQLEVWEKWKESLGVDHPRTLTSASNLASTYDELGRHHEALELRLEVWEKRKEVLGVDHPDTLTSAGNLASTYGEVGRHQDALQLQLEAWEKWSESLGSDHPDTLVSASNLASTYGELDRHQDALQLRLDIWEKRKETLGVEDPTTLLSGFSLACTYLALELQEQGFQIFHDVLILQVTVIGPDHPDTQAMIMLASYYGFQMGDPAANNPLQDPSIDTVDSSV